MTVGPTAGLEAMVGLRAGIVPCPALTVGGKSLAVTRHCLFFASSGSIPEKSVQNPEHLWRRLTEDCDKAEHVNEWLYSGDAPTSRVGFTNLSLSATGLSLV